MLVNRPALDTTEVDSRFLGVLTHDIRNREAVSRDQVGISRFQTAQASEKSYTTPFPLPAPANLGR